MMNEDPRSLWQNGATLDDVCKNPDGSFDGIRMLSALSGLDQREVKWTFNRMKELSAAGHGDDERKRIVKDEAISMPWLK
jgi:hypothetical protein